MASCPIADLKEIKEIVEKFDSFNPKTGSIVKHMEKLRSGMEEIKVVLERYWP